jgi:hypothetical protein
MRRPALFQADVPTFSTGVRVVVLMFRFGAVFALCALIAGCDPCGGPLKFKEFPKSCDYQQAK